MPMMMCNDSRVACIGEMLFGKGKGYHSAIVMTIGTGIGAGVVINDKLFEGNGDKGGEVGHTLLVMDGGKCTCGRNGCFEAYASARAIIRYTKEEMQKNPNSIMWQEVTDINKVEADLAFNCALKGDVSANKVVDIYIKYLGEGLLNICNNFRPEAIILGGGISHRDKSFYKKLNDYVKKQKYGYKCTPKVEILKAKLGNDAGIIGAAFIKDYLED